MGIRRAGGNLFAPLRPLLGSGERMTPGFLVVGTKRGGSTSAYDWIARHPAVAPCRTQKGTHYFDVNHRRGERWFRSGFERPRAGWQITGEASPYYMYHPLAPAWIAQTLPEVRLIAVLRDPVTRAWSHYQYERARGSETLPVEEALDREGERLAGEEDRIREDSSYVSVAHRHHSYLQRGHYAEQLDRLLEHFPSEQLLVLQSEQLFADPHGQLNRVWDFLGLERVRLEGLHALKAGSYDAMPEGLRVRLDEYYQPHNERLYAFPQIGFRWPATAETAR